MRLIVESYVKHADHFVCRDEDGNIRRVDLMTDKKPDGIEMPADLVGKTVEVSAIWPYEEIASGVKIIHENPSLLAEGKEIKE
jgi:hypothetical protein